MVEEINTDLPVSSSEVSMTPTDTPSSKISSQGGNNRTDIVLILQLRVVHVPVDQDTPCMIIWSRGKNKIQSKKKMLKPGQQTVKINDEFKINTSIELDDEGKPKESKSSKLSVVGSKAIGVIGTANLDLSKYGEQNAKKHQLPLEKCKHEGSYIEITLQRDMPKVEDPSTSAQENDPTETSAEIQAKKDAEEQERQEDLQGLYAVTEELKAIQKEGLKAEHEHKVKYNGLKERYNILSTELENTMIEYKLLLESITNKRSDVDAENVKVKELEDEIAAKKKELVKMSRRKTDAGFGLAKVAKEIDDERFLTEEHVKKVSAKEEEEKKQKTDLHTRMMDLCSFERHDTFFFSKIWELDED